MNKDTEKYILGLTGERREKLIRRFFRFAEKTEKCWLWRGGASAGYGAIDITFGGKSRRVLAHHLSYVLFNGAIPAETILRHSCDTPACVHPNHLLPGTRKENVEDMMERGRNRHPHGIESGVSVLNDDLVLLMRRRYREGVMGIPEIAALYGVHKQTAWCAIIGETWKHVPEAVAVGEVRKRGAWNRHPVSEETIQQIKECFRRGESIKSIALRLGFSVPSIRKILRSDFSFRPMKGEDHWNAKITEEQVTEMRRQFSSGGVSMKAIAIEHNVHPDTVWKAVRGQGRWSTLPGAVSHSDRRKQSTLTGEDVQSIRARYSPRKMTMAALAHEYGISRSAIHRIVHRDSWKDI